VAIALYATLVLVPGRRQTSVPMTGSKIFAPAETSTPICMEAPVWIVSVSSSSFAWPNAETLQPSPAAQLDS